MEGTNLFWTTWKRNLISFTTFAILGLIIVFLFPEQSGMDMILVEASSTKWGPFMIILGIVLGVLLIITTQTLIEMALKRIEQKFTIRISKIDDGFFRLKSPVQRIFTSLVYLFGTSVFIWINKIQLLDTIGEIIIWMWAILISLNIFTEIVLWLRRKFKRQTSIG